MGHSDNRKIFYNEMKKDGYEQKKKRQPKILILPHVDLRFL